MRIVYAYPGKKTTDNSLGWDEEWSKYSVERTISWNEHSEVVRILEKYLPRKGRIIEAGCGLGRLLIHFKNKGYDILGADWSLKAVDAIRAYDQNVNIECVDIRKLQYKDASFIAYISEGVVEHFQEGPMDILKEAHRVLADKEGILFISVPIYNAFMKLTLPLKEINLIRRIFKKPTLEKGSGRAFDYYLVTLGEFKNYIAKARFKIVKLIPILQAAGLYRAIPIFRNPRIVDDFDIWGHTDKCLNIFGRIFLGISKKISPWAFTTCVYCIAKKI